MANVTCPYCSSRALLVTGSVIYPHRPDLHTKKFYSCKPCDAYVGCHPGSTQPLGRLANAELRAAKMAAHAAFDPLWKFGGNNKGRLRTKAYSDLAAALHLLPEECHIGMFDVEMCNRVIAFCEGKGEGREE